MVVSLREKKEQLLSPFLADVFMSRLEARRLVWICFRYVDEDFVILIPYLVLSIAVFSNRPFFSIS